MTSPEIKAYMAELGRRGGTKSRRKLSRRQAKAMGRAKKQKALGLKETASESVDPTRQKKRKILVRDAAGARCTQCDAFFHDCNSFPWGWRKSQRLHENGCGHKMELVPA